MLYLQEKAVPDIIARGVRPHECSLESAPGLGIYLNGDCIFVRLAKPAIVESCPLLAVSNRDEVREIDEAES
jgi:hypothetical protein